MRIRDEVFRGELVRVLAIGDGLETAPVVGTLARSAVEAGLTLSAARGLPEGLRLLAGSPFEVALVDLGLRPGRNGDAIREIRKVSPGIAVVVIAGADDQAASVRHREPDAQECLVRGRFDHELLVRTIRHAATNRRAAMALERSEARFSSFSESGILGIASFDASGVITDANEKFLSMTGFDREEVSRGVVSWERLTPEGGKARAGDAMKEFLTTGRIAPGESEFVGRDGERFWGLFGAAAFGKAEEGLGILIDIDERKRLEEKVKHMADHDVLTGLPNRRLFTDLVGRAFADARRNEKKAGLVMIDLDRFKEVNDTLGHKAGDYVLRATAERLRAAVRDSDTVARFGGDEFCVLLGDISVPDDIGVVAGKVLEAFGKPLAFAAHDLSVSASIGIGVYPDDGGDVDAVLASADIALYQAKEEGGSTFEFHTPDLKARAVTRMRFESSLRQALPRSELAVFYQPLHHISTRRVIGAEALVRWRHPELGLLEARRFVPTAEAMGLMSAIDEWVLRTACTQFAKWLDAGLPLRFVSTNVSPRAFRDPAFAEKIGRILAESRVAPEYLNLEIAGSVPAGDVERIVGRLEEVARMGVRITMDDFGTGSANLSVLKKMPVQRLKIGRTFVSNVATDRADQAIVGAVTSMAHEMNLWVTAEGVEREDQLTFLARTRCDEAQGYLLNGPLASDEFTALVAADAGGKPRAVSTGS